MPPAPAPASPTHPAVNRTQILGWLIGGVDPAYVVVLVRERGVTFAPTQGFMDLATVGPRGDSLEQALKSAMRPAASVPAEDESLLAVMTRGMERLNAHDQPGTEHEMAAAVALAPTDPVVHLALGRALAGRSLVDSAMIQYRKALDLDPETPWAHLQIGSLHQFKRDLPAAIAEMHEEIAHHPANAAAHRQLAYLFTKTGDVPNAVREAREAVRLDPSDVSAHLQLANGLYMTRDFRGALAQAQAALAFAATPRATAMAQVTRGLALRSLFDIDGSIAAFRAAVAADSTNPDAHFGLARGLVQKGDGAAALPEFHLAMRNQLNVPDVLQAHIQRGMILEQQGDLEQALGEYRVALDMDPNNEDVARAHAELEQRLQKAAPARK